MDYHNFLRTRRSIRRFKPDPIPDSVIQNILVTATFAPSAHNRQPWRFVVLTKQSAKAQLADAMAEDFRRDLQRDQLPEEEIATRLERSRAKINNAPLVILLCMDASEMDIYPDSRRADAERIMAIQSTANAGLQLLLAIHAEGLGAVWTCGPLFAQEVVRKCLGLPQTWEPQAMYFVGHPLEIPEARERKPIEDIALFS